MIGAVGFLAALAMGLIGCGEKKPVSTVMPTDGPVTYEVVQASQPARPPWSLTPPPDEADVQYLVGISGYHATEQEARDEAMRDARSQFAKYTGVEVHEIAEALSVYYGLASDVQDPTQMGKTQSKEEADARFGRIKAQNWYYEKSNQEIGGQVARQAWQYWVLATVPADEFDKVEAWRQKQETEAAATVSDILASYKEERETTENLLAQGNPLLALGRVEGAFKSLQSQIQSLKTRGWPYDRPRHLARLSQTQNDILGMVRGVLDAIVIDTGRYSGRVYVSGESGTTGVPVWALCEVDGNRSPIANLPLVLRAGTGEELSKAVTDHAGKAVFTLRNPTGGDYRIGIDLESPALEGMDKGLRKVLAAEENRLSLLTPGSSLPDSVLVGVRQLFQGPARDPLPAQTVRLGAVTYESKAEGDTRLGGRFAILLKDEIRDKLTKIDGLRIIEPKARTVEAVEDAAKTRDLLNRGQEVSPKMQSASAQALIDGAEGALETRYSLYGPNVRISMQLTQAGTEVLLASAVVRVPEGGLPPGVMVRPEALPQYSKPIVETRTPIKVEVTSHLGDGETYIEGDEVAYFFSTDRDAYLLLIYEDAEGNLTQILPNPYSGDGYFKAGNFFRIPPEKADYAFTVRSPFGPERLWAFAASRPFPDLRGDQYETGRVLQDSMGQILATLRAHGAAPGVAYGEANTVLTTAPEKGN